MVAGCANEGVYLVVAELTKNVGLFETRYQCNVFSMCWIFSQIVLLNVWWLRVFSYLAL